MAKMNVRFILDLMDVNQEEDIKWLANYMKYTVDMIEKMASCKGVLTMVELEGEDGEDEED